MAWDLVGNTQLNKNHFLELWLDQRSQDVGGNKSRVYYEQGLRFTGTQGAWVNDYNNYAKLTLDGNLVSDTSFNFDFRTTKYKVISSGYVDVPHNGDGTKTVNASGSMTNTSSLIPNGSVSGSLKLTSIPRASSITTFNPFTIGSNIPWAVDRKHGAFTHWVRLTFEGQTIAEAVGQTGVSGTLGITQAMKNQMLALVPKATSAQATLIVWTYSSSNQIPGNQIGSPSVKTATATVGADIVPHFTGLSTSENVDIVRTLIGAYVQSKSKLNLAIVGAGGILGSWIESHKIVTAGTVINAASGVSNTITESGDIVIIASVTDSRGRTVSRAYTVPVLPYTSPTIEPASFLRCDANGTTNPLGTYVKVAFKGSVSSLKVGAVEKNKLDYRILSKKILDPSFTQKTNVTHSTLAFNSFIILSGYPIDYSYNLIARILDVFGDDSQTSSIGLLPYGEVLQHWGRFSTAFGMLLPGQEKNAYIGPKGMDSQGPISIGGRVVHALGGTIVEYDD